MKEKIATQIRGGRKKPLRESLLEKMIKVNSSRNYGI